MTLPKEAGDVSLNLKDLEHAGGAGLHFPMDPGHPQSGEARLLLFPSLIAKPPR